MTDSAPQNPFVIATLFPSILNSNGDAANGRVLARRARWADAGEVRLVEVEHADQMPDDPHFLVVGACSDPDMLRARELLATVEHALRKAVKAGVPVLAVSTGWYLLSQGFLAPDRQMEVGLGLFRGSASAGGPRVSDDLVVDSDHGKLVGFENHSTGYHLGEGEEPLGKVVYGYGNGNGSEGASIGSLFGTHLHGPILARNPALADHLLALALGRTGVLALKPSHQTDEADRFAAMARAAVTTTLGI